MLAWRGSVSRGINSGGSVGCFFFCCCFLEVEVVAVEVEEGYVLFFQISAEGQTGQNLDAAPSE